MNTAIAKSLPLKKHISMWLFDALDRFRKRPFDRFIMSGIGVEVGVWRGTHAANILRKPFVKMLYLVDPYQAYNEPDKSALIQDAFKIASEKLARVAEGRHEFILSPSVKSAEQFKDLSLDFCYIDAAHDEASAKADIAAWFPKVRIGGLFGGHDYTPFFSGVRSAVDGFASVNKQKLYTKNPDWWVFKQ